MTKREQMSHHLYGKIHAHLWGQLREQFNVQTWAEINESLVQYNRQKLWNQIGINIVMLIADEYINNTI